MEVINKFSLIFCFITILQIAPAQDLSYEQYTEKDGLPSMQTYDIIQDSSGLLWIGTENGLVSFDGDEFKRYSHPELIDNDIVEISLNRNGRIYFTNLSRQLAYLENNEITIVDISNLDIKLRNICSHSDKDYLITSVNTTRCIFEIIESPNGSLKFRPTDIYYFNAVNEKTYTQNENKAIYDMADKSLITLENNFKFDDIFFIQKLVPIDRNLEEFIRINKYQRLVKHQGNTFIIQTDGLTCYNSKTKKFYPILSGININIIFFDAENTMWISTLNRGLLKISNVFFIQNQSVSNLTPIINGVNDIVQDGNGNNYLGTLSGDIIIRPFKDNKKITISEYPRPIQFIENNSAVFAFNDKKIVKIDSRSLNYEINPSHVASLKSLLIGDDVAYFGDSYDFIKLPFEHFFSKEKNTSGRSILIKLRVSTLYKDEESRVIYAGSVNGLYYSEDDIFRITENSVLQSLHISNIVGGENNSIWVATKTQGIFNVRNDSILTKYNTSNGLISNNINDLEVYDDELLVSTNSGLSIINLFNGRIKTINEYNFLPSNEVFVCKVINGKYWIGTVEGLTILSKEDINSTLANKSILSLKGLYVNGIKREYDPTMVLNYTENNIQLNFQHISFKSRKDKYIKYRLPFSDSIWITTKDQNLRLPSLNPDNYHVEVIGVNSLGLQSTPLNIFFKIDHPWWHKTWAKLLGVVLLIGFVYSIILYRSRRIRKEEAVKRDYLSQINRIKEQALQLQMNPHFIFNSLNAIQGFIGTDEEEKAMNYLARFAKLIRLIFEHSKGKTISLEEELEFINLYLDLEKLRFKDKVNVKLTVDQEVENNKDIIKIPPLLIQPMIENSFKHGLFHKKGIGNLNIDYSIKGDSLQIVIQDDGIGRALSQKLSQKKSENQTSSGIKTTRERLELLNFGKDNNLNGVEIEDLYDEKGISKGTKTTIRLSI